MLVTEDVPVMPGPLGFGVGGIAYLSVLPVCYYQQYNYQMWRYTGEDEGGVWVAVLLLMVEVGKW